MPIEYRIINHPAASFVSSICHCPLQLPRIQQPDFGHCQPQKPSECSMGTTKQQCVVPSTMALNICLLEPVSHIQTLNSVERAVYFLPCIIMERRGRALPYCLILLCKHNDYSVFLHFLTWILYLLVIKSTKHMTHPLHFTTPSSPFFPYPKLCEASLSVSPILFMAACALLSLASIPSGGENETRNSGRSWFWDGEDRINSELVGVFFGFGFRQLMCDM